MNVEILPNIIANQGFPIALSILLIFRIDRFMQEIVIAQKEGYWQVLENTKEIHNTITTLNQQNREYYSLRLEMYLPKGWEKCLTFTAFCGSTERTIRNEGRTRKNRIEIKIQK